MKKSIYLFIAVLAIVSVFTSCEKDEPVTPEQPKGVTIDKLVGDWNFVSVEVDGNTYTNCGEIDYAFNSYLNVKADGSFTRYNECSGQGVEFTMTVVDNKIIVDEGNAGVYEIVNAETFDGTLLKLKNVYNGSTYIQTLQYSN